MSTADMTKEPATMNQEQRLVYLLNALLAENNKTDTDIPEDIYEREVLLRSLFNLRDVGLPSPEFLGVQDAYLQEALFDAGIISFEDLPQVKPHLALWQGNITLLDCDAIINPASPDLLGCWTPGHACVDNAVHSFAGVELRTHCFNALGNRILKPGEAFCTPGFNLPANHIIHTVGPYAAKGFLPRHKEQLIACYTNCYKLAEEQGLRSIAFPTLAQSSSQHDNQTIARIAIRTIRDMQKRPHPIDVAFVIYPPEEYQLYAELLNV